MPKQILAWRCKYCGAVKNTYYIADRHEKSCLENPNGKNCLLCIHRYKDEDKKNVCTIDGKLCTRARSAKCEHFERVDEDE